MGDYANWVVQNEGMRSTAFHSNPRLTIAIERNSSGFTPVEPGDRVFYLAVDNELFCWEVKRIRQSTNSYRDFIRKKGTILELILTILLLAGEVRVTTLLLNREEGLFFHAIGGELFRWKEVYLSDWE